MQQVDVAVVGGGISGLTAAFLAQRSGATVRLYEPETCGGVIKTRHIDGFTAECGPNVFIERTELMELIGLLKLEEEVCFPVHQKFDQFVAVDSRLQKIPRGPVKALSTPLIAPGAKLQCVVALLRNCYPGKIEADMSVADFFEPLLGRRGLDLILEPAMRGIYGGDIDNLSTRFLFGDLWERVSKTGGLRPEKKKVRPRFFKLRSGNQILTDRLESTLNRGTIEHKRVTSIESCKDKFLLKCTDGTALHASTVVLAAGPQAGSVLAPLDSDLAVDLQRIPAVGLVVAHFSTARLVPALQHAFGILFPARSNSLALGLMCNSVLFPHSAPPDRQLLTVCFKWDGVSGLSDQAVAAAARDVLTLACPQAAEAHLLSVTKWPFALPRYRVGHCALLERVAQLERNFPGLFFTGRDVGKPGVSDRVAAAFNWVNRWKDLKTRTARNAGSTAAPCASSSRMNG